jgi:hypothetical protein
MRHFPSFALSAPVERTAVAARPSSPGTGQEGPLLAHGRMERERGGSRLGSGLFPPPPVPRPLSS